MNIDVISTHLWNNSKTQNGYSIYILIWYFFIINVLFDCITCLLYWTVLLILGSVSQKEVFHVFSTFLFDQTSDLWNKRHSVAIGDVHECKLIRRKEITPKQVDHIWKSMTVAQYVTYNIYITYKHFDYLCFLSFPLD